MRRCQTPPGAAGADQSSTPDVRPTDPRGQRAACGVRGAACGAAACAAHAARTYARNARVPPTPRAAGVRFVELEKERRHTGPKFASSPSPRQSDGRGHRRGLDGPTMPLPNIKTATSICPNRQPVTSEGGWGRLPGEVKEGIRPKGEGGTRARKTPPPSLLRPSRHATTANHRAPTQRPGRHATSTNKNARMQRPSRPAIWPRDDASTQAQSKPTRNAETHTASSRKEAPPEIHATPPSAKMQATTNGPRRAHRPHTRELS